MDSIDLVEFWMAEAVGLRAIGEDLAAEYSELHALQLRVRLREGMGKGEGGELLTVRQAARRSGFTTGHLRYLLVTGKVPNAGQPSHPRIRPQDLPRRQRGKGRPKERELHHDPARGILSLFGSNDQVAGAK